MPDMDELQNGTLPDMPAAEQEPCAQVERDAELDALLADVKSLLGETPDEAPNEDAPQPLPAEMPAQEPCAESSAPLRAEDIHIDYEKFYGETPPEPVTQDAESEQTVSAPAEPEMPIVFPPLTFYEQSRPAYQAARRAQYEREREQERLARERELREREEEEAEKMRELEQRSKKPRRGRAQPRPAPRADSEEYAQWLYEQGEDPETAAQRAQMAARYADEENEPAPREKKHGGVRNAILIVLGLLVACCVVLVSLARQPVCDQPSGTRRDGCSTILLAGVDEGGYRTDTMMLMRLDRETRGVSLVSIPRDTLVYCEYAVPKINSAYGWAGGGADGIEELLERVTEIVGFRPDGYMLIDMAALESMIDRMGGVRFNVPMDMYYADPSQGLSIQLSAGEQKLSGAQSLQLLRFRSGYPTADLGRVSVQREFISAALDQWTSLRGAVALPGVLSLLKSSTISSFTTGNYLWLAETLMLCDLSQIQTATLPGAATYIAGGSYYVLDAAGVAETVNTCCNPYEEGVAISDLYIRVG